MFDTRHTAAVGAYPAHGWLDPAALDVPAPSAAAIPYGLVALGGSAGAIPAFLAILARLPAGFPIPVVVVQHLAAGCESRLPEVLGRRTALRCAWARDGRTPRAGAVYVAPRGAALTLTAGGHFQVTPGPKPRMGGPSVDTFLESVAEALGRRAIAAVLSGALSDGTRGIRAVRRVGGATMAQSVGTAEQPGMPAAALDFGRADLRMPPERIAEALLVLAERGVE